VIQYLKFFTLLPRETIAELEQAVATEPHRRAAQARLAVEVTRLVHGEEGLNKAREATDVLFGGRSMEGLSAEDLLDIFAEVPSSDVPESQLRGAGMNIVDLALLCGLEQSKKQVRNLIQNGGLYLNDRCVADTGYSVGLSDAIDGRVIVLRKGKKSHHLVQIV
jgi:tyrosyl-tRNA synthetase